MIPLSNIIQASSLSLAWAEALLQCSSTKNTTICPSVVEFDASRDENELENIEIRKILDDFLSKHSEKTIETVANTIFPVSIWRTSLGDRVKLYSAYIRMFPHLRRFQGNCHGTYFARLINYPKDGENYEKDCFNQLEHIIQTWENGNYRRSALQAAIFNPFGDHCHQRQRGFPCLQQVLFHPQGSKGEKGLSIIGVYATQTIIEKAYGNYLGLYRLGKFMAEQLHLKLVKVSCMASVLKIGNNYKKSDCTTIIEKSRHYVNNKNRT